MCFKCFINTGFIESVTKLSIQQIKDANSVVEVKVNICEVSTKQLENHLFKGTG